jgi:hypothetical protein
MTIVTRPISLGAPQRPSGAALRNHSTARYAGQLAASRNGVAPLAIRSTSPMTFVVAKCAVAPALVFGGRPIINPRHALACLQLAAFEILYATIARSV